MSSSDDVSDTFRNKCNNPVEAKAMDRALYSTRRPKGETQERKVHTLIPFHRKRVRNPRTKANGRMRPHEEGLKHSSKSQEQK